MSTTLPSRPSEERNDRPTVGVVIGSGGIKTLAAVELFRFLDRENIPVDLLVGSSGGSIMAALRGTGHTPEEMAASVGRFWNRRLFSRLDLRTVLSMARLPFFKFQKGGAFFNPAIVKQVLRNYFKETRLEDLKPTTVLQATDADTGEGVVLSNGLLADAAYVSGAQFPFLPPAQIDGRWLVDGGFSSPLPIMEAVRRQCDVIIAIAFEQQRLEFNNFVEYCLHFFSRTGTTSERSQTTVALDMHHHEIIIVNVHFEKTIAIWDTHEIPAILEAGKQCVGEKSAEILAAFRNFKPQR